MDNACNPDPPVTISSNTLFHFTCSIDHVISILEKDFRPNLSLEDLSCLGLQEKVAIPMVSFCDIPLSQAKAHISDYGRYGIGLSKSWGIQHGISPVIYTYQGSALTASLCKCLHWIHVNYLKAKPDPGALADYAPNITEQKKEQSAEYLKQWDQLLMIQCFLKPYEGPLHKKGKTIENVRFYNEREWRFVADLNGDLFNYLLNEKDYNDIATRKKANEEIQKRSRINFGYSDIKYIIVSRDEEILPLIKKVEEIRGDRYDSDQMKVLNSKIVTADQIIKDF
jgi:hypothetical protein